MSVPVPLTARIAEIRNALHVQCILCGFFWVGH